MMHADKLYVLSELRGIPMRVQALIVLVERPSASATPFCERREKSGFVFGFIFGKAAVNK